MSKERIMFWSGMLCMSVVGSFFIYRVGAADSVERIDGSLTLETIASCSLSADGEELHCENLGITDIDEGVFEGYGEVKKLYLFNNDIEFLPDGVFEGLDSLEHLNIEQNKIEGINENTFDGIRGTLKRLYLYDNSIERIGDGAFSGMYNLEVLILQNNHVGYLPAKLFNDLISLKELSIYGNDVGCYPVGLFDGLGENVEISKDGIPSGCLSADNLFDVCEWLSETGTLDCSNRNIEFISGYVFEEGMSNEQEEGSLETFGETGVMQINLSSNKLEDIPFEMFSTLENLEYVNMKGNPLVCKQSEWNISDREEGGVSYITMGEYEIEIDSEIGYCKSLDANNLYEICDVILPRSYYSEGVEENYPSGVRFNEDSDDYIVDCRNRGITSIASSTFVDGEMRGVSNYIYLSGNKIRELSEGTFSNFEMNGTNENVIDLSNNMIENVEKGVFNSLRMYSPNNKIHLENNRINKLDERVFDGLVMQVGEWCPYPGYECQE